MGTILDDDAPPTVYVRGNAAAEDAGVVPFSISLTSNDTERPVSVHWATRSGTAILDAGSAYPIYPATAGSDYQPASGTVTFQPHQTSQFIDIPIVRDGVNETTPGNYAHYAEYFEVDLSDATNATIVTSYLSASIIYENYDAAWGPVNIEMDSNGDGTINTDDEAVEDQFPGRILHVGEDIIIPGNVSPSGGHFYEVFTTFPGFDYISNGAIDVYSSASGELHIRGAWPGRTILGLRLGDRYDTIAITVVASDVTVDLDVDSDNDGRITSTDDPADDPTYEVQSGGKLIATSDADDAEHSELAEARLSISIPPELSPSDLARLVVRLDSTAASSAVRIWRNSDRTGSIDLGHTWTLSQFATEFSGLSGSVWVEALQTGSYLLQFVLAGQAGQEVQRDEAAIKATQLTEIEYRSAGLDSNGQDATGELTHDNIIGMGGWRFYPDGKDFEHRDRGRNIVRVRAKITPAVAGVTVYFKAFDVDDPSNTTEVDPTPLGSDNRGSLDAGDVRMPGPSNNGDHYEGRLGRVLNGKPVGDFLAERSIVAVKTNADGIAEVDLLTTFAPGDNFRVSASTNKRATDDLIINDPNSPQETPNDVPSDLTNPNGPKFPGKATEQLSIWRHLHVEHDIMKQTVGDKQVGLITGSQQLPGGIVVLSTNLRGVAENEFQGGILRVQNVNYVIVGNTGGNNVTVQVLAVIGVPHVMATFYQDDWTAAGNAFPKTRVDTTDTTGMFDYLRKVGNFDENRFREAYIQPELNTLAVFNSKTTDAKSMLDANPEVLKENLDKAIASKRGTRHKGDETDLFWVVYVATAFQSDENRDYDPSSEGPLVGTTNEVAGKGEMSMLFMETIRDFLATGPDVPAWLTMEEARARVAVHEIAHQLFGRGHFLDDQGIHRNDMHNIMDKFAILVERDSFYFADEDIDWLRDIWHSPGQ